MITFQFKALIGCGIRSRIIAPIAKEQISKGVQIIVVCSPELGLQWQNLIPDVIVMRRKTLLKHKHEGKVIVIVDEYKPIDSLSNIAFINSLHETPNEVWLVNTYFNVSLPLIC